MSRPVAERLVLVGALDEMYGIALAGAAGLGAERRAGPQPVRRALPASAGGRSGGPGGAPPG